MLEKLQCFVLGHAWQEWTWDPTSRLERHACTRCSIQENRSCQHEGQELAFVGESERISARYDLATAFYQNFLDRSYRCGRCDGEVTKTQPRDFMSDPVLEGRNVDVRALRANPCGTAGRMLSEVVQWSGGRLGWSDDEDAIKARIHLIENQPVLDISHGAQNGGAPTARYSLWSDAQNASRGASHHLCEYIVEHSSKLPSPQRKYHRLGQTKVSPVIPDATREDQSDRVLGRRVTVCAFPDYAPWLIGVTQTIIARLEKRGATVQVDLLESTVSRPPRLASDVDILLMSTRAGETDHGPYRAREVGMVYRVTPSGAWETGTGLEEIFGVVDECDIAYWPNPPLPLLPNTVEGHSVRPVIEAVDQVLRQLQSS